MSHQTIITELENLLIDQSPATALKLLSERFSGEIVFSTSFGLERAKLIRMQCLERLIISKV